MSITTSIICLKDPLLLELTVAEMKEAIEDIKLRLQVVETSIKEINTRKRAQEPLDSPELFLETPRSPSASSTELDFDYHPQSTYYQSFENDRVDRPYHQPYRKANSPFTASETYHLPTETQYRRPPPEPYYQSFEAYHPQYEAFRPPLHSQTETELHHSTPTPFSEQVYPPPSHAQPYNPHPNPSNPQCLTIVSSTKKRPLDSSFIKKDQLVDPDTVISYYHAYKTPRKVPYLAWKLAAQSYFGENVLIRCTVGGFREYPALPRTELMALKQKIFLFFPQFWNNKEQFEPIWSACADSIGQLCKRLRADNISH